jgi:DNA-binding NtrC family response regulator
VGFAFIVAVEKRSTCSLYELNFFRIGGVYMIKVVQTDPRRSAVSLALLGDITRDLLPSVGEYGISATLCSNVQEASDVLGKGEYQALLLDLKMRGANQFLQHVRAKFPSVAVLVFTQPRDLRLGILATIEGASAYIQTPLEPKTVVSVLKRALQFKRLSSALQNNCRHP